MKSKDLLISLMIHLGVFALVVIASAGVSSANKASIDIGSVVQVSLPDKIPGRMPSFDVPSAAVSDPAFVADDVKLSSITEKEKINKPKPKPKQKTEPKKPPEQKPKETFADASQTQKKSNDSGQKERESSGSGVDLEVTGSGGVEGAVSDGPLAEYYMSYPFDYVQRQIRRNWTNPVVSNARLHCVIYCQITKNGQIQGVAIKKSSGNNLFDRYARLAVESTGNLPDLPQHFPPNSVLEINFHFESKL